MSIELKEKLYHSTYVYGPLTRQEAFSISVTSFATMYNGQWYAGTHTPYEEFADKLIEIEMPLIEETLVEVTPTE